MANRRSTKRQVVEYVVQGLEDLYDKHGAPFVNKVLGALGSNPEPSVARKAVIQAAKQKNKAKTSGKGTQSVATTFDKVTEYDKAMSLAQKGRHLKRDKTGQYVGAPRDMSGTGKNLTVNSPASLAVMRRNLDQKAKEGLFNASWYDRTRDTASDLTGFDLGNYSPANLSSPEAAAASLFARGTAAYSPQYTPLNEVNAFAKQHNAKMILGEDAVPKTRSQAANVAGAYNLDELTGRYNFDPMAIRLGKKTSPYADAKDPTIDPQRLYKTANDLWHGRVVGYSQADNRAFNRAFTPQEHGFLIGENLLAADRANKAGLNPNAPSGMGHNGGPSMVEDYSWTPRSVQAATWGAQRIESANAKQAADIASYEKASAKYERDLRKWEAAGKPKGKKPKSPKAPVIRTPEEIEAYARYGIDDAVNENLAAMTSEYMPGFSVKQAPELFENPDLANEFSDVMAGATGTYDPTLKALQTYTLPIQEIPGGYMNSADVFEENKAYYSPLLGSTYVPRRQDIEFGPFKPGVGEKRAGPQMDEATEKALRLASILNATRHAQEGTGANMFIPQRSTHRRNQLNAAQLEGDRGSLDVAIQAMRGVPGLDVVDLGDVARVTQFPRGVIPAQDGKPKIFPLSPVDIQQAIQSVDVPEDIKVRAGRLDSTGYWPEWAEPGSGQMTEAMLADIDALGIPNVYERLDTPDFVDPIRRENEARQAFFEKYGLTSRPDIQKFNELLAEGGPKTIRDYVAKYGSQGLPVIVGGMTFPALYSEDEQ